MKPVFGALNTKLAKLIAASAPRYSRIVEPWGDGGTYALVAGHKPAKEHVLNIVNEEMAAAMLYAKNAKLAELKSFDWVASPDTFEKVSGITALEGAEAFYRYVYLKKFGMKMRPDQPMSFDVLKTGEDISRLIYGVPLMKALLKNVEIVMEDQLSLLDGGSDTLLILLPSNPEDVDAVKGRVSSLGGNVFFSYKIQDAQAVIDAANSMADMYVSPVSVASIMMATMVVATNYENKLPRFDPDEMGEM